MKFIVIILIVLVNAFFVSAEFALLSVRRTRLDELVQQGNLKAKLVLDIKDSFNVYLGAIQLGVTAASLALGWLGQDTFFKLLWPVFDRVLPGEVWLVQTLSVLIAFMIITYMHIVLGELVPKAMAICKAESLALRVSRPLYLFRKIFAGFIWLFSATASYILNLFGMRLADIDELAHSEEELRLIVDASHRGGIIDKVESEIIDNVFDFSDRLAREIMLPRQDMVCLFIGDSFEANVKVVRESCHTRYPVCEDDKDNIIGMIHIRDLMDEALAGFSKRDLGLILREVLMIPESMPVSQLLQLMRKRHIHMAVVVDEFGGTAGMVAMEDILEELVGEIQDEHDGDELVEIEELTGGQYRFDGRVLVEDVIEILQLELLEYEEDTIGGLVFGLLGRRPLVGDVVSIGDYNFEVLAVNGLRIMMVKAFVRQENIQDTSDDAFD